MAGKTAREAGAGGAFRVGRPPLFGAARLGFSPHGSYNDQVWSMLSIGPGSGVEG
jgi:hypothetical protein